MNEHSHKIETVKSVTSSLTLNTMKEITYINIELHCGIIEFGPNKQYFLDFDDFNRYVKFDKKFSFITNNDIYPSYCYNYKRFTILEFIYNIKQTDNINYIFKNRNIHDLRRVNIDIKHKYHDIISQKYDVIQYIQGHINTSGKEANIVKNPIWKINENNNEYLLMYCEPNTICKLCTSSYQKIMDFEKTKYDGKKITFYKQSNGYISCHSGNLYIHQIITGCYGNGKGTKNISVDHIDQDPLNNTYDNLRVVSQGTKRARKKTAKPLPDGITEDMVKKYVYYAEDTYGPQNKLRNFFRVCHPKLDKEPSSSKSEKVSILEKLAQANKIMDDLENDIYPIMEEKVLPTFVSNRDYRGKPHLTFDRKAPDGQRQNVRMVLPQEYNLQHQLNIIREKIKIKYNYEI
jgi:hypothetical protein